MKLLYFTILLSLFINTSYAAPAEKLGRDSNLTKSQFSDYQLHIEIRGSVINEENKHADIFINIDELNNVSTDDKQLKFAIPKNENISLNFMIDSNATITNDHWEMEEQDHVYLFTYVGENNDMIFPAGGHSTLWINTTFTPPESSMGSFTFLATILHHAKESTYYNNSDYQSIEYRNF